MLTGYLFYLVPVSLHAAGETPAGIGRLMMAYGLIIVLLGPWVSRAADRTGRHALFAGLGGLVGGAGTLQRSMNALGRGGKIGLIGVLSQGSSNPHTLMLKGGHLHGIFVGDRTLFEQLVAAINANGIRPVIDKVFPFDQAKAAFADAHSGDFMGKVVIRV